MNAVEVLVTSSSVIVLMLVIYCLGQLPTL